MSTRPHFIKLVTAGIAAGGIPQRVFAATPYKIEGEYRYGNAGLVRSLTFPRTAEREAVQCNFATLIGERVKAAIVSGSQLAIPGLQLWQVADKENAVVAVNGGFFQANSFWYDGLLIMNGRQVQPKNTDYSGAVVIDANGILSLERINDVAQAQFALQTGPFFIDPGGSMGMRSKTTDLFRRSFIAQSGTTIVTGITTPVSLYQLADLMLKYPDAFLVDRFDAALNLSGAATAAFFARIPHDDIREGGALNSPAVITFSLRA